MELLDFKDFVAENFKDGRNPQDKGDMARHGLKGKSISQLKQVRGSSKASPRAKQLAHWYINMHKEDLELEHIIHIDGRYRLVSKHTGRNLGTFDSLEAAKKREQQIQYFKHMK